MPSRMVADQKIGMRAAAISATSGFVLLGRIDA